ncbi:MULTISPECIES: glycosyltransferase family 1 protein [unclassified Methylophaga]|uniref:glycosyltransferase family 4 protein n=1 Tax=unclassified Methylophaga TaxID=2629249 RepID=UPI0025D4FAC8|nr:MULTISPECIES: glycosyltransferase family 1 protein [unclassified Methylophaga]
MKHRVAFTLIGGHAWMGGLNYQVNLISALLEFENQRVEPILFLGDDVAIDVLERFNALDGLKIVHSQEFNRSHKNRRLLKAIVTGCDTDALAVFKVHEIDVVFEAADFYGWHFNIPTIAWIPDLQHRKLRQYFGFFAFWKREIGFRMQVYAKRHIMLSSLDAAKDFQQFYKLPNERLHVVNFSVPVRPIKFDFEVLLAKYNLPRHFFYLPNQFWQHKNHECVIKALGIAKREGKEIIVAVSGNHEDSRDPDYFPKLLSLIAAESVEDNFRVLGMIPYDDVQALMLSAAALINPSRFEGWSTTVEEAKSLGVEMLLSDINVHREQAEQNALFFEQDKPAQLAEQMITLSSISIDKRIEDMKQAAERSRTFMSLFAMKFTTVVEAAAKSL